VFATAELDVGEMADQSTFGALKSPHRTIGQFIDSKEFSEIDND